MRGNGYLGASSQKSGPAIPVIGNNSSISIHFQFFTVIWRFL